MNFRINRSEIELRLTSSFQDDSLPFGPLETAVMAMDTNSFTKLTKAASALSGIIRLQIENFQQVVF